MFCCILLFSQHNKGDRIPCMGPDTDRCRMVREHRQHTIKFFKDHPDNAVNLLNRTHFFFNTSQMSRFIGCLNMEIHKVEMPDRFECISPFCSVISIKIAGGTRNRDDLHPGTTGNTVQEVNCRDHSSFLPVLLFERGKCWFVPSTPRPDAGGCMFACPMPCVIHRMVSK